MVLPFHLVAWLECTAIKGKVLVKLLLGFPSPEQWPWLVDGPWAVESTGPGRTFVTTQDRQSGTDPTDV